MVKIGTIAVVKADQAAGAGYGYVHAASSIRDEDTVCIQGINGDKDQIFAICRKRLFVRGKTDDCRIAEGLLFVSCDHIALFVVGNGFDHAFAVRNLPVTGKCRAMSMVNLDDTLTLSLIEEFYFRSIGIPEAQLEANVRDMIENISCYTISTMLANYKRMQSSHVREKRERLTEQFLREMLPEKIECPVYFMLYRNKEGKMALSMADHGFEKPAILKHNRRGSWLILKRKEMQGFSRINGEKMSGHLDTLKYDQEGTLIQAECRDDMIRIPLRAFQFHRRQGGEVRGVLSVTMTCSVGRSHMPESTAVLVFWM